MTIRAVLFDLDNTLVDFLRMKRLASAEAARATVTAGASFPFDADEAGQRLYDHYLARGIDGDDAFSSFIAAHNGSRLAYGHHPPDRILAAAIHAYQRAKDLFLQPYPAVRRTLVELVRRGLRLGVVTDAPRLKGWQRLTQLGLAEFFDVVVTLDDAGRAKPDPAPFRRAVEALSVAPSEILFVGDWPERDIAGAQAAGMRTAFARYGRPDHQGPHGAHHELASIADVLTILEPREVRA